MRLQHQIETALRAQLSGERARPPEAAIPLWNAFNRLSRARSWHAHGPNPITFQEIEAYCRLHRLPLEPRHIDILSAMDGVWINHVMGKVHKGAGAPEISKHALTGDLFDAMFA